MSGEQGVGYGTGTVRECLGSTGRTQERTPVATSVDHMCQWLVRLPAVTVRRVGNPQPGWAAGGMDTQHD
jgi:hypothetical protein